MKDIFSIRLTRERELRGFNKGEAAKFLGLQNSTYCHYEQGNRHPDYDALLRIAESYEVSVDYLLGKNHLRQGSPDMQAILDLTDDQIVKNVKFKVDSEVLTAEQVRRLIAFVRSFVQDGANDSQQSIV